jgi:hypothetical protein
MRRGRCYLPDPAHDPSHMAIFEAVFTLKDSEVSTSVRYE